MTILKWSFAHLAGLRSTFISSYRWRWIMCLLLGMSRALAMVSALKVGSRTITAPWMPLFWRLSAYSCIKKTLFQQVGHFIRYMYIISLYIVKNGVRIQIGIGTTAFLRHMFGVGCWKFSLAYYTFILIFFWSNKCYPLLTLEISSELCLTLRSMSLIHLMTRWLVQTTGSRSRFSHWARRACIFCRECIIFFNITNISYFQSECDRIYTKIIASLSKLSICRSWMADRMLVTWNLLVTLKMASRSLRVIEFSTLPSTNWLWKTWEYWGSPDITQPALRHPVMIHISSFGKS